MAFDLKKAVGQIAKNAVNMQEAQKGGGDYTPPAEGACFLRFVAYIELGKQKSTYKGETKIKDKVRLCSRSTARTTRRRNWKTAR